MTLQEIFGRLLKGEGEEHEGVTGGEEGRSEVRDLRQAKARLNERLRQTEDMQKMELQQSKVMATH